VLMTAGRFGGDDLHQALVQRLDRTADRRTRDWLLDGIASARAPELLDENVSLATSGKLNPREISDLLTTEWRRRPDVPLDLPVARERILAGIDHSWDRLVQLMPRGALHKFFDVTGHGCSPGERADGERVFGPRAPTALGGPRAFAIALERLDLCIDERARDVPELERFFPAPRPAKAVTSG